MGRKRSKQPAPTPTFIETDPAEAEVEAKEAGTSVPENAMGRKLAHADKKVRDKAITVMTKWISQQRTLTEDDHLKLWKALYYCYWMSDKAPVQQDLACKLSELMHAFPTLDQSLLFLRTFFLTMLREWQGIDRLRLDKFYNLVRCFQREAFAILQKGGWRAKDLTTYNNLMAGSAGPLRAACPIVGFQLHVVEIFLDELSDSMKSGISPESFTHLISPYLQLLRETRDIAVIQRVIRLLEVLAGDKWFAASLVDEDEEEDPSLTEPLRHTNRNFRHTYVAPVPQLPITDACKDRSFAGMCAHSVTRRIFRITISPKTTENSRKKLYELLEVYKDVCMHLSVPFTEDPDDVSDEDVGAQAHAGKKGKDSGGKKRAAPVEEEEEEEDEEEEDEEEEEPVKPAKKAKKGDVATPGKKAGKTPIKMVSEPEPKMSSGKKAKVEKKQAMLMEESEKRQSNTPGSKKLSVEERRALRRSVDSLQNTTPVLSTEVTSSPRRHAASAADFFIKEVSPKGREGKGAKKGLEMGDGPASAKKANKGEQTPAKEAPIKGASRPPMAATPKVAPKSAAMEEAPKGRSPKPRSAKTPAKAKS